MNCTGSKAPKSPMPKLSVKNGVGVITNANAAQKKQIASSMAKKMKAIK